MSWRSTDQYAWNVSMLIGKGAMGTVYQGMNKKTGEQVAIKTFNLKSQMRTIEVQMREFELMRVLKHKNIVRLLAIEEEARSRKNVIITELCTGGDLYTILCDPENSYGLAELDFLCVLKDISAGMKYLRDNKIIHRDLKPGNIMKFIAEDGTSVYKLIDFDAARQLEEGQQFVSLYGTEAYLHPDMYERAFLSRPTVTSFQATVDLWSIGVTLYHVATGSLPFRPFSGKTNRKTMFTITKKKDSGVISGVQHTENGPIEWSSELPKTCLLSQELQDLVTPMLAGTLECDHDKMWSFNQYFDCVSDILSRQRIHVFFVNESKEKIFYLKPKGRLRDLQLKFEVPLPNQILLFDKVPFVTLIDPNAEISTYPETLPSRPLILLHSGVNIKVSDNSQTLLDSLPNVQDSQFMPEHAKSCCEVAYAMKRIAEDVTRCTELLLQFPPIVLSTTRDTVKKLEESLEFLKNRIEEFDQKLIQLEKICDITLELDKDRNCENDLNTMKQIVSKVKQPHVQFQQDFTTLKSSVETLKQRISGDVQKQWDNNSSEFPSINSCNKIADTYVKHICQGWQTLVENQTKGLNDPLFLDLVNKGLQNYLMKLLILFREQCLKSHAEVSDKVCVWYSNMQESMVQCMQLSERWASLVHFASNCRTAIDEAECELDAVMKKIISQICSSNCGKSEIKREINNRSKPCSKKDFIITFQDLIRNHSELNGLVDNHVLLTERLSEENMKLKRIMADGCAVNALN